MITTTLQPLTAPAPTAECAPGPVPPNTPSTLPVTPFWTRVRYTLYAVLLTVFPFLDLTGDTGKPYSLEVYTGDEGLPQDAVGAVVQSGDGYLWAGTGFGLARFDGARFRVFEADSEPALERSAITCLLAGDGTRLWIGTQTGLVLRDGDGFTTRTGERQFPAERINWLTPRREGGVWVGAAHGLVLVASNRVDRFTEPQGLLDDDVQEVHELPDGRVLVRHGAGWQELEPGRGQFVAARESLIPDATLETALPADLAGRAWAANRDGVWMNDIDGWRRVLEFPPERRPDLVRLHSHPTLGLLVLAPPLAVHHWDGSRMQVLAADPEVVLRRARALTVDREGSLWFAGERGLARLHPRTARVLTTADGLPDDLTYTTSAAPDGSVWVGTGYGVARVAGGRVEPLALPDGARPGSHVVLAARNGDIWLSPGDNRIFRRPAGSDAVGETAVLGGRAVRCLFEDRQGGIWAGTSAGLFQVSAGGADLVHRDGPLAVHDVRSVLHDRQGVYWVGTRGGLFQLRNGIATPEPSGNGAPTNDVRALWEDRRGNLWAGSTAGLHLRRNGAWQRFDRDIGLAETVVNQLLEDDAGRLWMAGLRGIHAAPLDDLLAVAGGEADRVRCLTLGRLDGLLGSESRGGVQPAGSRDARGDLWFPTLNGLVRVLPGRVAANLQPPRVVIERVLANGRELPADRLRGALGPARSNSPPALQLHRRDAETLTVEFTAATFIQNRQARIRYRLDGHPSGWREVTDARSATYTSLPAGRYAFELLAANGHGIWTPDPVVLRLEILPHYYETGWFFLLVAVALVACGLAVASGYHRRREAGLAAAHAALEAERSRIAKDLHDDIGASLTGLAFQAELARSQLTGPAADHFANYAGTARGLVDRLRQVIWAMNPACDTLEQLATYLGQYLENLALPAETRLRLDIPTHLPAIAVRSEVRHHLLMAVKEAVTNALRHSGAGELRFRLRADHGWLEVTVEDTGRGLPAEMLLAGLDRALPAGHGLANLRSRMAALGGSCRIQSRPGEGTTVTLRAPVAPDAHPLPPTP